MKVEKTDKSLKGVKCIVNTCIYHEHGNSCSASNIEIQPQNASSSKETGCATFSPHNKYT